MKCNSVVTGIYIINPRFSDKTRTIPRIILVYSTDLNRSNILWDYNAEWKMCLKYLNQTYEMSATY